MLGQKKSEIMIVVKIAGGLGNQLFQYAAGRSLALTYKTGLLLDLSFFNISPNRSFDLDAFKIIAEKVNTKEVYKALNEGKYYYIDKILGKNRLSAEHPSVYKERFFNFDPDVLSKKPPLFLDGYWQSEFYFMRYATQIRDELQFKNEELFNSEELVANMRNTNSVCIHLRRNDYVTSEYNLSIHGVCSDDYYFRALEILKLKQIELQIYVFSDDLNAADSFINKIGSGVNVSRLTKGNHLTDFYLMQQCKYYIIANSTFSWWAAWLSKSENKIVFAPQKWFADESKNIKDLFPVNWQIL
jgi:hypothetical protein